MEKTCPINLKKDVMEFLEHISQKNGNGNGKGKGKRKGKSKKGKEKGKGKSKSKKLKGGARWWIIALFAALTSRTLSPLEKRTAQHLADCIEDRYPLIKELKERKTLFNVPDVILPHNSTTLLDNKELSKITIGTAAECLFNKDIHTFDDMCESVRTFFKTKPISMHEYIESFSEKMYSNRDKYLENTELNKARIKHDLNIISRIYDTSNVLLSMVVDEYDMFMTTHRTYSGLAPLQLHLLNFKSSLQFLYLTTMSISERNLFYDNTSKSVNKMYTLPREVLQNYVTFMDEHTPHPKITSHFNTNERYVIEYHNTGLNEQLDYMDSLQESEHAQIKTYTETLAYKAINKAITQYKHPANALDISEYTGNDLYSKSANEFISQKITVINDIFRSVPPLKTPITVYRGYSSDIFLNPQENKNMYEMINTSSYLSTSLDPMVAYKFAHRLSGEKGTVIEIRIPAGAKILPLFRISKFKLEYEVLLKPNSVLIFKGIPSEIQYDDNIHVSKHVDFIYEYDISETFNPDHETVNAKLFYETAKVRPVV